MARNRKSAINVSGEAIDKPRKFTQKMGLDLWRESSKRLEVSRDRILAAEDIQLGTTQLSPPRHLARADDSVRYLIPTLPQRKSLVLNMTNTLAEVRPSVKRQRPPKGGPTSESRAEETETALNALLLDLFPWDQSVGRAVQHAEYAVVTLLAEDAWDASPDYDDVLSEEDWKKLPAKEKATYRAAEDKEKRTEYKRPKKVYWRDGGDKGIEDEEYGRRDPGKTRKAYDEAMRDHLAQHPPFAIRGYSALDAAPVFDATGLVALCVRQLMEPSALLSRGYRCEGLAEAEDGTARVMIPAGFDANLWGKGGKVWLYQFYLWIDGDPCVAYMVGGQATDVQTEEGERIEAVTNLREKWGFTRLPVGYYYGLHLETDNPDNKGVPFMDPIGPSLIAAEGAIGAMNMTAWRRGTSKYTVTPGLNVPPAAYLDSDNNLKPIDIDPDKDIVTVFGDVGHLAPLEHSGDTRYVIENLLGAVREATPSSAAFGGEGADSGREAALLHTYAQSANRMVPEGLRKAVEDSASFIAEWACGFMRTKKISEIPYYANVEADPQEGDSRDADKTVMVRLREDWIGKNYRVTAKYPARYNPVMVQQAADLYEKGLFTFEDVMEAAGKTNPLRQRVQIINGKHFTSEKGLAELSAIEARQRGDVERAKQYEALMNGQAAPLEIGPDGNPTAVGPSAALDPMFSEGGGTTSAQQSLAGTIGAGRGAEMGDAALTTGVGSPAGIAPPNGVGGV